MTEDQVARLRGFEADHRDIEIRKPDYGSGAPLWSAHRGGLVLCAESELRVLLDKLNWLLSQQPLVREPGP